MRLFHYIIRYMEEGGGLGKKRGQCYTFVTFAPGPLTFKMASDRMTPEVEECPYLHPGLWGELEAPIQRQECGKRERFNF